MADLVAMFGDAGCSEVEAYIQSRNVVFRASSAMASPLPALIEKTIAGRYGLRVPVVVRTADELRAVVKGNPFLRSGVDVGALHVGFLAGTPSARDVDALDPHRSPADRFEVRGREIYLHCPNGVARTKLTNQYFDSRLSTTSTVRNWRTVLKLVELAGHTSRRDRGEAGARARSA